MSWDPLPLMEAFPFPTDRWLAYRSAAQAYFGALALP
jgi:hypothetical protein